MQAEGILNGGFPFRPLLLSLLRCIRKTSGELALVSYVSYSYSDMIPAGIVQHGDIGDTYCLWYRHQRTWVLLSCCPRPEQRTLPYHPTSIIVLVARISKLGKRAFHINSGINRVLIYYLPVNLSLLLLGASFLRMASCTQRL